MYIKLPQRRSKGKRLLEALYCVPNPLRDYESWQRFCHYDLQHLSQAELLRERERARLRVLLDDDPTPWLLERLGTLEGLIRES